MGPSESEIETWKGGNLRTWQQIDGGTILAQDIPKMNNSNTEEKNK
jgi:hypothetical protein